MVRATAALVAAVLLLGACWGNDPCSAGESCAAPRPVVSPAGAWERIADAPTIRQEVAAAVVGGKIYVVGGLIDRARATNVVEVYDPSTDKWSSAPSLPIDVHHAMAAERDGRLYVIGGFSGSLGGAASDRVFMLDGGRWREAPSLQRPRAAAAAVSVSGGRIFLVGGVSGNEHVAPSEIFDGSSWRNRRAIPSLRDHLAAATDGRLVYAIGGRRAGGHFGTVEVYDVETDRWQKRLDMPTPRSGLGAAFVQGVVVAVGGEGPRIFPEVEAFDAPDRWRRFPDLAVPVHGVGVVAVGPDVYALAGGSRVGTAPTNACQVLRLTVATPGTPRG
jgi:hypothetical protein